MLFGYIICWWNGGRAHKFWLMSMISTHTHFFISHQFLADISLARSRFHISSLHYDHPSTFTNSKPSSTTLPESCDAFAEGPGHYSSHVHHPLPKSELLLFLVSRPPFLQHCDWTCGFPWLGEAPPVSLGPALSGSPILWTHRWNKCQ